MYDRALEIFQRNGDDAGAAWTLNNLGIIHRTRRDHVRAIETYERSLDLKTAGGDTLGLARTHHNLGLAWSYVGDHEKSLDHFDREFELLTLLNADHELDRTLIGKGMALHHLGRSSEAAELLERGMQGLSPREVVERATALLHLGSIDLEQGRAARGMQRMKEAWQQMEQSGRLDLLRNIARQLAMACDRQADDACAAKYWHSYAMLSDSIASEQQQWAMEEMQARYENRDKENTIRLQEMELEDEREQRRLYRLTVILAILLLVASSAYALAGIRNIRRLRAANRTAQNALVDRELLLKEMHHRVKNNLQMLNSLLSIQSRALKDPHAREAMKQNRERVQAIGLIHQFLYTRDSFRKIDMQAYLRRLLQHLSDVCELQQKGISLHAVTEAIELDVDVATPIGLIVNELVTNSIKHAFAPDTGGEITVTLQRRNGTLLLQVTDNGRGMPEVPSNGFGKVLLEALCNKLGARIRIMSGEGTGHEMEIPHEHGFTEVIEHPGR
jgi:two-component system, sensor histidine kinase PdtaS